MGYVIGEARQLLVGIVGDKRETKFLQDGLVIFGQLSLVIEVLDLVVLGAPVLIFSVHYKFVKFGSKLMKSIIQKINKIDTNPVQKRDLKIVWFWEPR